MVEACTGERRSVRFRLAQKKRLRNRSFQSDVAFGTERRFPMPDLDLRGIATTAKLAGHPLHPMLVPFPIAFFVATFACDVVFWATHDEFWALMGMWALGAGIVMAALAAVAGFTDFLGNARIRSIGHAWHHMLGNVAVVILSIIGMGVRKSEGAADGVLPWGLVLSFVVVLLLLYTGWKGGELAYGQRVGMRPEAPPQEGSSLS
jgi:uncharacterized membrane protein